MKRRFFMSSPEFWMALLAGVMILAGVFAFGGSFAQAQQRTPTPTPAATPMPSTSAVALPTTRSSATATPTPVAAAAPALESHQGIPAGFTVEGQPFLGDPDAPLVLNDFSDYLCPFCARHFRETYPLLLDEYVAAGKLRLVIYEFPIASLHPTAPAGHQAALCVAEQGAALFWAMHDALYARQDEWNRLPDPVDFLATLAAEVGAAPDLYTACMADGRTLAAVEAGIAAGEALGYNGTPSFQFVRPDDEDATFELVGAYPIERFREVIDAMLAGEEPPAEPTPEPPQLPYWAGEGLAPDPDRPGFTLAGDPYKGNEDAPLTVVEFSDFQCPSCARHALDVQPVIDAELVDAGQVRWVFKNFPLREHAQTFAAAAAAECAGDQGEFWPMHDLLFTRQDEWAVEEVDAVLAELATALDLDVKSFSDCTAGRQALERVLPDLFDAQGLIDSTPTFILLDGESGAVYRGVRDANEFVQLLTRFIKSMTSQEAAP